MIPIRSITELDSMTEEQRYALFKESAAALVRNFKDVEARELVALLNDYAVRKWLSTDRPLRRRRVFGSDKI